ncbi:MAG TPA: GDSL-type esterase/lipase family protein, partial [Myxococcota bacterium]|nr:GDSL-type esterase/lipase family protein [Myxococcota bacterium]
VPDGEFTEAHPLGGVALEPGTWHELELAFADGAVAAALDGTALGSFSRAPGPQRVGFRGGQRRAEVDDVVLEERGGRVRAETFANRARFAPRLALVAAGLAALALAGAALLRRRALPPREIGLALTSASLVLACAAAATWAFAYVRGPEYRLSADDARAGEAYWIDASRRAVVERIRASYPPKVPPGTWRLLVLGTSQTWGAGARTEAETWVRQLEALLARRLDGVRVEVVNAGVSGLRTGQVLQLLRRDLAGFEASAALVNLSNNDRDPVRFRAMLESLAAELERRGIPAVLALEANSPERRTTDSPHGDLAVKHQAVREVAAQRGLPVVDLHALLLERRDAGLLWWDFVHLTSFGQRLVARALADALPPLVGPAAPRGAARSASASH